MKFSSYVPPEVRAFITTELASRRRDLEDAKLKTDPVGRAVVSELRRRIKIMGAFASDERMRAVYEFPLPESPVVPTAILEVIWSATRASLDQRKNAEAINVINQSIADRCEKTQAVIQAFQALPHGAALVREAETTVFFGPLEMVENKVTKAAISRKKCPHREFLRAFYGYVFKYCHHKEDILMIPHAIIATICDVVTDGSASTQDVSDAIKEVSRRNK